MAAWFLRWEGLQLVPQEPSPGVCAPSTGPAGSWQQRVSAPRSSCRGAGAGGPRRHQAPSRAERGRWQWQDGTLGPPPRSAGNEGERVTPHLGRRQGPHAPIQLCLSDQTCSLLEEPAPSAPGTWTTREQQRASGEHRRPGPRCPRTLGCGSDGRLRNLVCRRNVLLFRGAFLVCLMLYYKSGTSGTLV